MNRRESAPVILEVASALLVPAAAFGFSRVFLSLGSVAPIVGTALLSTAVAVLLRRLRTPLPVAALVSLGFLAILVMNRFAPGTALFWVVPTGTTRVVINDLLAQLVVDFRELKTPVPGLDPFVAAAMLGAWIMAFLTDWGALRLRLAFEPVLPAALLFVFSSVLGAGTRQFSTTVILASAVAFWAVTQRTVNLTESSTWLANDRQRGYQALFRAGAVAASLALLAGVLLGPWIPGADANPMFALPNPGNPSRRVTSPFVSLEAQLVNQQNVELFTVASDQPSYWRLAGLDSYEDNFWQVDGTFTAEDGRLPDQGTLGGSREEITQVFSITALDAIWVPAAYAPVELGDSSARITWHAETSSLTVSTEADTSNGLQYTLVSSIPRFTAADLAAASDAVPPEIAERYLEVPPLPRVATAEAERVTATATTRYDKMLALQNYFQNFDYSTELSPRVGDPLEQFLTERVGFCQQFSATFALMARYLGIPSRVATGFTWGDRIGTDDEGRTIYQVTGRQAHAWPEVWFDGLGWVAFEPTPGRGSPNATGYSNLPALQDSLSQPANPELPVETSTTVAAPAAPVEVQPSVPVDDFTPDAGLDTTGGQETEGWIRRNLGLLLALPLIAAVAAIAWFGPFKLHELRRRRRRQRAATPAERVEVAWAEAVEALELHYRLGRDEAETRAEYAGRLLRDRRPVTPAIAELAELATVARYFQPAISPADAERAGAVANEIAADVERRFSLLTRWKRAAHPRSLLRPTRRITLSHGRGGPTITQLAPAEARAGALAGVGSGAPMELDGAGRGAPVPSRNGNHPGHH